jgi:hypothetical protein
MKNPHKTYRPPNDAQKDSGGLWGATVWNRKKRALINRNPMFRLLRSSCRSKRAGGQLLGRFLHDLPFESGNGGYPFSQAFGFIEYEALNRAKLPNHQGGIRAAPNEYDP